LTFINGEWSAVLHTRTLREFYPGGFRVNYPPLDEYPICTSWKDDGGFRAERLCETTVNAPYDILGIVRVVDLKLADFVDVHEFLSEIQEKLEATHGGTF
jgi:hypothetical protein